MPNKKAAKKGCIPNFSAIIDISKMNTTEMPIKPFTPFINLFVNFIIILHTLGPNRIIASVKTITFKIDNMITVITEPLDIIILIRQAKIVHPTKSFIVAAPTITMPISVFKILKSTVFPHIA
jgi:hypothetical protein